MADQDQDQGGIDPNVQALINRFRQQQLLAQLQENQQSVGNPTSFGGGLSALGAGLGNAIRGYQNRQVADTQQQMQTGLVQSLGGFNPPAPDFSSHALPPMATGSVGGDNASLPPALQSSAPTTTDTAGSPLAGASSFFMKKGWSPNAAHAMAATLAGESTPALNTGVYQGEGGFGKSGTTWDRLGSVQAAETAGGIANWNGARAVAFKNWAQSNNLNPNSRDAQLNYVDLEARKMGMPITSNAPPDQLTNVLTGRYESPAVNNSAARWANYTKNIGGNFSAAPAPTVAAAPPIPPTPAPQIKPTDYGVPAGAVAGPGVPSNLPPPVEPTTPAGRAAALGVKPPPPPADEEEDTDPRLAPPPNVTGPTPSQLSPVPMGPSQGLTPVGPPPAPAPATPMPPPGPPPPAVVPPAPVQPSQAAPGAGAQGSAYDPRTGRFLAPGEQIPGYAPAPASSTGGPGGGLEGLLASLLGGGSAQAAPAAPAPPPLARALTGAPAPAAPQTAPAGLSSALSGSPAAAQSSASQAPIGARPTTPVAQAPAATDPRLASLQNEYNGWAAQRQKAAAYGMAGAGTPVGQQAQAQAQQAQQEMDRIRGEVFQIQNEKPTLTEGPGGSKIMIDPRTGATVAQVTPPTPKMQPLTDAQATQFGIADKAGYVMNPATGKPEQIAGTNKESQPASIKEFEYGKEHPDFARAPKWVPNARVNDLGQPIGDWVTPPNPANQKLAENPTAGLTPEQQKEIGTPNQHPMPNVPGGPLPAPTLQLTDEQHAVLDQIPEARRGMVQSILQRDMVAPPISAKNPLPAMLRQDITKIDPNFDFASQPGQVKAKSEFLTGGPSSYAKQIEFGNTGINHLADYTGLSDNLDKQLPITSDSALANIIGGPSAQELGVKLGNKQTVPQGAINALHSAATTFSGEFTKYLTGAEGSMSEREAKAAALGPDLSPYARKDAVMTLVNQIEGRKSEIQAAWHNAVGPNVQDFPVLSPKSEANLAKIKAWATAGQGGLQGNAPEQSAPAGPSAAPAAPAVPTPSAAYPNVPPALAAAYASGQWHPQALRAPIAPGVGGGPAAGQLAPMLTASAPVIGRGIASGASGLAAGLGKVAAPIAKHALPGLGLAELINLLRGK